MKSKIVILSLVACATLMANDYGLERIVVSDSSDDGSIFMEDSKINKERFAKKSITTLSSQANMNPFHIINYSPSVHFTPTDMAGSNEPTYHDPIRIRGKSQTGPGGVFMIDGIPLSSNPGGGKQMVDMENLSAIDLYKGYLPVDKNLGFSSLIGKVDMRLKEPSDSFKSEISQGFGSDSFMRTFVRVDSGKIGDFSLFGSFSRLSSDKNRGSGDLERLNGAIGIKYEPNSSFKAKITAIRNSDEHHNYYTMSYDEAKNIKKNRSKDFASNRPMANDDVNYYDWNKQDFTTTAVFGDFEYRFDSDSSFSFKPYYKKDKGDYWFSNANANAAQSRVMNWRIDHDLYGGTAAYSHKLSDALKSKIGYWYHKQLPPGPPSDQVKYKVVNGQLVWDGYGMLADNDYHTLQAPFIELSGEIDRFSYSAGVQYQTFELGALKNYTQGSHTTAANPDYDSAIAAGTIDPMASVDSKKMHTVLPSLYLGYKLSRDSDIYLDYSRTYGFDVNLFPTYNNLPNRQKFKAAGIALSDLWDELDLELSDNIDLGLRTNINGININPALFVSFVKNKQVSIYDPAPDMSYPANIGKALGYGAELNINGPINESLEFITSLSYNRYSFRENYEGKNGTIEIKGNQLPDAPRFMAKAALSYNIADFTITPSVRYTSSRWGDVGNTEKIPSFTLADLDMQYKIGQFLGSKDASFRVTANNLFDKKYISTIITADNDITTTGGNTKYQAGMGFAMFAGLNLKF